MKTKTTVLLLSLIFSFGFFAERSVAASPSGLPTTPSVYNPAFSDITTPPPANNDNLQDGMNPNFIGAISNPFPEVDPNPIKVTKKDAVEKTTPENIITIPLGRQISIYLKKKSFPGNRWFLETDNDHIQSLNSNGVPFLMTALVQTLEDVESGYEGPFKYSDWYIFKACSLGETVLTFQTNDELVCHPETLTFRFNVVEAPATSDNSNSGATTPEQN